MENKSKCKEVICEIIKFIVELIIVFTVVFTVVFTIVFGLITGVVKLDEYSFTKDNLNNISQYNSSDELKKASVIKKDESDFYCEIQICYDGYIFTEEIPIGLSKPLGVGDEISIIPLLNDTKGITDIIVLWEK